MQQKNRIVIEIIVAISLITAAVYFFVGAEKEPVGRAGRADIDSG